jgi:hypothetical protein
LLPKLWWTAATHEAKKQLLNTIGFGVAFVVLKKTPRVLFVAFAAAAGLGTISRLFCNYRASVQSVCARSFFLSTSF